MATIRKRENTYQIRVFCGYDTNGNQVIQTASWKPETTMTPRQADKEAKRQAMLFEEKCLKGQVTANITFETFAEQWFEEYARLNLRNTSFERMRQLRNRVYPAIGHLRMDKITPRHLQRFVNELCGDTGNDTLGAKGKKLSPKTVKLHLSLISTIFDYAIKMQMLQNNPCRAVTLPSPKAKEREVYTLEEAQQLLELFEKEDECNFKYVVFFTMAMYTGLRRGELLGLEWKDFDWDNEIVSISRTSMWTKEKGIYTDTPKTKTSMRTLKLPKEIIALLQKYRTYQTAYKATLGSKWIENDRLFTQADGKPMDMTAPYYYFQAFCERTGMRFVNIHRSDISTPQS